MDPVDVLTARAVARAQARLEQQVEAAVPSRTTFVTDPTWCNFNASPVQRALVSAADGEKPTLSTELMKSHFGVSTFEPTGRPRMLVVRGGVRSGKSLLGALVSLIYGGLFSDLSCVRPGELVRSVVVAPRVKQTAAAFHHVSGTIKESARLKKYLVSDTTETIVMRRWDGIEVETRLMAASRGGINVRSTWLAGALFDEADFFDAEDAQINLKDNVEAAEHRMVPDAQIWVVSSPWADTGPFHGLFTNHFGGMKDGVMSFHSDSRSMNPKLDVDSERKLRRQDPDKASREYDAIPISSSSTDWFPSHVVDAAVNSGRPVHLPPNDAPTFCGVDLGFTKNSSAIAISRRNKGKVVLAYHEERRPPTGDHLKPSVVIGDFARLVKSYRGTLMRGDKHYVATAQEELEKLRSLPDPADRVEVVYDEWSPTRDAQTEAFTEFRRLLLEGLAELPDDPVLIRQIKATKQRVLPGGAIQVVLPKHGNAHGDVLMSVVLSMVQVPIDAPAAADEWAQVVPDSRWDADIRGF